jgi:uncharacterized protein involved in exopolysaccharide biosynthesis
MLNAYGIKYLQLISITEEAILPKLQEGSSKTRSALGLGLGFGLGLGLGLGLGSNFTNNWRQFFIKITRRKQ